MGVVVGTEMVVGVVVGTTVVGGAVVGAPVVGGGDELPEPMLVVIGPDSI